jgi:hypothetical protein
MDAWVDKGAFIEGSARYVEASFKKGSWLRYDVAEVIKG